MRTGIKPRVNEAREFLEIAKDFKDPREILREAISNSWDANATRVSLKFDLTSIPGSLSKKIVVRIEDDGDGMSSDPRPDDTPSEIEGFFNLGDSYKGPNQIGSKGHGTKIFYKSSGIHLETFKNGKVIKAYTESDPWQSLRAGKVPTYCIDERDGSGKGTLIKVDGFEAKHKEFSELSELINYIKWYTVAGSFGHYFASDRQFEVELKPIGQLPVTVPYGFSFPDIQDDLQQGT
ncbi:MAG: ATP-binding protein, partial [Usitatibacteraceae bacterium]